MLVCFNFVLHSPGVDTSKQQKNAYQASPHQLLCSCAHHTCWLWFIIPHSFLVSAVQINRSAGDADILGTHGTHSSHSSTKNHNPLKTSLSSIPHWIHSGLPISTNPFSLCILIQQYQVTGETAACSLCKYLKPRLSGWLQQGRQSSPISWTWHNLII